MHKLVMIMGAVNILLVFFQLLSGLRIIKVSYTLHRRTGMLLLVCAIVHGTAASIIYG